MVDFIPLRVFTARKPGGVENPTAMSHQPKNIQAGTQVVSLVEIRGPNGSLVHPRGAVGVVTRTPAVEGENFLVRFPDGFEKSLDRSQLEILKDFPAPEQSFAPDELASLNWWQQQFTLTNNCAPGGVMLMFCGPIALSPIAAAWVATAWTARTIHDTDAFSKVVLVVPPPGGSRESTSEVCFALQKIVAESGGGEGDQARVRSKCAGCCIESLDAHQILSKLEDLPDRSAIAITHVEWVRYSNLEVDRENTVTTHTGLHVHFTSDEQLFLPHVYRFVEDLAAVAIKRDFSIVILAQLFGGSFSAMACGGKTSDRATRRKVRCVARFVTQITL